MSPQLKTNHVTRFPPCSILSLLPRKCYNTTVIKIEKLIPGGMGLGTDNDGRKVFFWNALPGETVTKFSITKSKSHYAEAIAEEIKEPSPHRVEPKDACFLSTSPWQILNYDYELHQKQALVVEIFQEHQINIATPDIVTDHHDYFYRNKMEYSLYWNNETEQIQLAFHVRGTHRKLPITSSSIERPEIFQHAQGIINQLNNQKKSARDYQSLLLRCDQDGLVKGGLYEKNHPHPEFPSLTDTILDYSYSYSPNGFFQINLPVYEMALHEIKKHINTNKVLDLYAGVGTIGLSVARDRKLTLVEVDRYATSELFRNCQDSPNQSQNQQHMRFQNRNILAILAKSEESLEYLETDQTVILDPPRAGCDKKLITKLNEIKPETIIYLSCNPTTQARDIKFLLKNYQIQTVKTFNFFPHTPHIENLIVLTKIL